MIKRVIAILLLTSILYSCGGLNVVKLNYTDDEAAYPDQFKIVKGLPDLTNKTVYLHASGYYIYVELIKASFNYENVQKIQSFRGNPDAREIKLKGLADDIRAFKYSFYREQKHGYYAKKDEKHIYHIVFSSETFINEQFEIDFVNTIQKYGISEKLLYPNDPKTIDVLGNEVDVLETCGWRSPLSLQCRKNGQINWAYHSNLMDAKTALKRQRDNTIRGEIISPFFEADTLNSKFLGKNTQVEKLKFTITYPTNKIIRADNLYVYYVAMEYGDVFLHAVLSHYNNDDTYIIDQFLEFE